MSYKKISGITISFVALLAGCSVLFYFLKTSHLPDYNYFLSLWDSGWYKGIAEGGYLLKLSEPSNPAFYPLYPYLWKWISFSNVQMVVFNALLFFISFAILCKAFSVSKGTVFCFLALGFVLFFFVPYSESLFFLGSTVMLMGLQRSKASYTITGVVIAILTRSASQIFVTAFALLALHFALRKMQADFRLNLLALLFSVAATCAVFYVHYYQTGDFFAFFEAQKFWDHSLRFPQFPLTGWGWPSTFFDGGAFVIGLVSMAVVVSYILQNYFGVKSRLPFCFNLELNGAELFSLLYIAGTTGALLVFQGGNLHSINRYVFSTPFYLVFINLFAREALSINIKFSYFMASLLVLGLVLPSRSYAEHYLQVSIYTCIMASILFYSKNMLGLPHATWKWVEYSCYFFGFAMQCYAVVRFFDGTWMG